MTKQEAIDILWRYDVDFEPHPAEEVMHAIDMAIEALESQERTVKTAQNVSNSDVISKKAEIDALEKDEEYNKDIPTRADGIRDAIITISTLPSAQPERKKGKWILHLDDLFPEESTMECNQCHEHQPVNIDDNYCPNCGADMRGEEK